MTGDRTETPDDEPTEEAKPKPKSKSKSDKRKVRRPESGATRTTASGKGGRSGATSRPGGFAGASWSLLVAALVALGVGIGVGWVARGQTASESGAPAASSSAATATDGSPCDQWAQKLCQEAGSSSEACTTARSAAELLPASACEAAHSAVPATLAKLKTARSTCDELVSKLCADLGESTESCQLVKERTPSFPTAQCREMLKGYDDVLAELRQMERTNAPLTPAAAAAQAAGQGPSFGPASAKVTVVEYSDFECPFCSRAAETVKKLKENYGDRVRFVFRQYPLPMHQHAALASEAALEAHAQGKFWELHDKMFANQRALDRASIEGYAKELGLNMARFKKALDDGTHRDAVKADQALGELIGVSGTPTMIVNTKRVPDPSNYAALASLVDAELAAN